MPMISAVLGGESSSRVFMCLRRAPAARIMDGRGGGCGPPIRLMSAGSGTIVLAAVLVNLVLVGVRSCLIETGFAGARHSDDDLSSVRGVHIPGDRICRASLPLLGVRERIWLTELLLRKPVLDSDDLVSRGFFCLSRCSPGKPLGLYLVD